MTKLEAVARAICLKDHGYDIWADQAEMVREQYRGRARAAVEALRGATESMQRAGQVDPSPVSTDLVWNAMIDAILSEKPE